MLGKIGSAIASFSKKVGAFMPLLNQFIQVKISENDTGAILEALTETRDFAVKMQAFSEKGMEAVSDSRLSAEEIEMLLREMVELGKEVDDIINAFKSK